MKKLLLILLCVPLIGLGQETGCISGDCENGYGTQTYNGDYYVGYFKDGMPHGERFFILVNGDKYVGEHKDGKRHGQGTYTFGKGEFEGDEYVGGLKENMYHGQGTYTEANGTVTKGLWKNDEFIGEE